MADAQTHVFVPNSGVSMKQFNEGLEAACEKADVTEIKSEVVDGALMLTLLVGTVEATEEDVEEAKDEDGKAPFAEGDEIPEGDRLMVKATKLTFLTAENAEKIAGQDGTLEYIYSKANGLILDHRVVTGRALVSVPHPEDLKKAEGSRRMVYVEKDVSYAVVIWSADDDDEDGDEDKGDGEGGDDVADTLRRPSAVRSAADIVRGR